MHARAHAVVQALAAMPDGDEDAEILCDGIRCVFGADFIARATVNEMLRATAITESWSAGTSIYYRLTDTGRSIARRPELADEVYEAILRSDGPFTIVDDRIAPLSAASKAGSEGADGGS